MLYLQGYRDNERQIGTPLVRSESSENGTNVGLGGKRQ